MQRIKEWVGEVAAGKTPEPTGMALQNGAIRKKRDKPQTTPVNASQSRKRTREVHLESDEEPLSKKPLTLRYDHPLAIYQRYTEQRSSWYRSQPQGASKTDQAYREAMGLPQYSKQQYAWCLDLQTDDKAL